MGKKRRGVVIVAVLVVVMLLSLSAYQYSDMMLSEYKAALNSEKSAQARHLADSGIHYAAAMLSNPDSFSSTLNGNFWNNPTSFQDVAVPGANGTIGRFSLIAPADPDDPNGDPTVNNFGVVDESGKINLNAMMMIDPTGNTLYNMLMLLPNMTDQIANSIIDWIDPDATVRSTGAESDFYEGLSTPYQAKNAPGDSIDELMLVQGVTWPFMYGTDFNRNGVQDGNETTSTSGTTTTYPSGFDRGWSAYLTVNSREMNTDANGNPLIYLNDPDLSTLFGSLSAIDNNLATFIILYRQYGGSSTSSSTSGSGGVLSMVASAVSGSSKSSTPTGSLGSVALDFTKAGNSQITSLWGLVNSQVSVTSGKTTTVYASPFSDPSQLSALLPQLFAQATLTQGTDIPARINVNTAPSLVLATIPGLTQSDVQNIINTRTKLSATDPANPAFQSPTWLYTQGQMSLTTLSKLDKYVTTRSQVFRIQSVGYFDGKGPSSRIEAVIDTNGGRPRILSWRDLTELGKGYTSTNSNNPNMGSDSKQ